MSGIEFPPAGVAAGRILIVDDDAITCQAISTSVRVQMAGLQVDTSSGAHDALKRIKAVDYDAILTDIRMPDMDGLDLLSRIRSLRPETPTLLMTGYDDRRLILEALRRGAFDYIPKPIELDYFIASAGRAVRMCRLSRQVKAQQAELERSREDLRALAAKLITVQEEERRRISCELHDDLTQRIVVLIMKVETLQRAVRDSAQEKSKELLQELREQILQLSGEVRRLSHQLHPSILDHFGLAAALQAHITDFSERERIYVAFSHSQVPESLPRDIETCLYRVAQEALHNIAKHARAATATVRLRQCAGFLHLFIHDSGVGFDLEEVRKRGGLGLISMQERVRLVHGRLRVRSQIGVGTFLFIRIPLPRP
jgi:signal transduction histidine kinase